MDIRQLKTFVEVAANGSYARTAAIVGVAQSALSRQMSALERGIGGRLFHRTGRGVVLTELGERMLPRARALVADAAAWQEAARSETRRAAWRGHARRGAGRLARADRSNRRRACAAIFRASGCARWKAIAARSRNGWPPGRVEIAIYNRYRRGRVASAEPLARADVHLIIAARSSDGAPARDGGARRWPKSRWRCRCARTA